MEINQIYEIVNGVAQQTLGSSVISVIDTNSLVSLGDAVLSSSENTENFANVLVQRIAKTIISYRMYNSILKPLVFDDVQWGAIIQKIKGEMPEAVEDDSYKLTDGKSVDMYIVNKPKMHQKFFVKTTPYSFYVTIQRWQLKRAFLGSNELASFVSAIFGEVRNKLELTFENLGYLAMGNYMANMKATQVINLVSLYNAETGSSLTSANCMHNSAFLRYAIMKMNLYATRMTTMSKLYNAEDFDRHSPINLQRFIMLADFNEYLKTVVQWEAFNVDYVTKTANIVVPYWQSAKNPLDVDVTDKDGNEVKISNIVGFIHDRDALGTYRMEDEVLTTPVNARGRYTNTFWHEQQLWFNDLSENGILFTLN